VVDAKSGAESRMDVQGGKGVVLKGRGREGREKMKTLSEACRSGKIRGKKLRRREGAGSRKRKRVRVRGVVIKTWDRGRWGPKKTMSRDSDVEWEKKNLGGEEQETFVL